jgi:hypothetical protein
MLVRDGEVGKLRTILYQLAEMDYQIFKTTNDGQKSNSLYKSIN